MKIRNVMLFVDTDSAILGGRLEVQSKTSWMQKMFTFRDIVASDFVFATLEELADIYLSASKCGSCSLIYPVLSELRDNRVMVAKLPGVGLCDDFDAKSAISSIALASRFIARVCPELCDAEHCRSVLTELYTKVDRDIQLALQDARELKLLRRPEDINKVDEECPEIIEYFKALEIDRIFNNTYVQGSKDVIHEADLVMPYNEPLKKFVTNGIVDQWQLAAKGDFCKIGPTVNLPVPRWMDYSLYYEQLELTGGAESEDFDSDEDEVLGDDSDKGVYIFTQKPDAPEAGGDKIFIIDFKGAEPSATEDMLDFVDFTVEKQDSFSESADGTQAAGFIYRTKPKHKEVYHFDEFTPSFYDSFDYEALIEDTSVNVTGAPVGYIKGFEAANKVPLLPREKYWYTVVTQEVRDSLMYENLCFSVVDADAMIERGERSRFANILFKQMIEPVLQVTRGFTGRVTFNGARYFKGSSQSDEDGDNSGFSESTTACFYTIRGGRYISIPTPMEYSPTNFGMFRSMYMQLIEFNNNYVRDTFGLVETLIRLLRDKELKPTMLVLGKAFQERQASRSPIYFDLLEAKSSSIMGGLDSLTPCEYQELAFGIRLTSNALQNVAANYASEMKTNVLGDGFEYRDGYIVGVGLWSGMEETQDISKVDFMDIFTLVSLIRDGGKIASVPVSVSGILYDKETGKFRQDPTDSDVDNVLGAVSDDGISAGCILLKDAAWLHMFETKESRGSRGQLEREIRSVLEPIPYIKARAEAAQLIGIAKMAQDRAYQIFTQLEQLSNEPKRLDNSLTLYNQCSGKTKIPVYIEHTQFIRSMLDIQYTVKFLKLVSYCVKHDIQPNVSFVDYLNAVSDFLDGDTMEAGTGSTSFQDKCDQVKKWFDCIVRKNDKQMTAMLIGEVLVGQKRGYVLIEGTPENRDLINAIRGSSTYERTKALRFEAVYPRNVRPLANSSEKLLFTPNDKTLKTLDGLARQLGV